MTLRKPGLDEEQAVHRRHGKWSTPGVPHKGWRCVGINDLGNPDQTCEMCESSAIRYVHVMEHDDYPRLLEVGCICAGHLEEDPVRARDREHAVKNRAGKRARWLTRKWRESSKGNEYLRSEGYRVVVRPVTGGWAVTVADIAKDAATHSKRVYDSPHAAKLAAFDFISAQHQRREH